MVEELPDSAWGNCRDLSVALNDRERTLLHFDVPVHRITTLHSAELVVEINSLDLIGQRKPVRIDLHRITQSWEEASLTWRNQPEYENTPAVTTEVDLEAGKVHIDVTPLVNEWIKGAPNYGVLIKTSTPHRTNKSEHSS